MPNTFSHIGVQLVAGRGLAGRKWDGEWLTLTALGCLIPDLPWIAQRALRPLLLQLQPPGDGGWSLLLELRLWCVAASSLVCCLLLCAALCQLFERRLRALAILSIGSLLHLLLDGLQTKWGNGVILAAPFHWRTWRADLFWPEAATSWVLTGWGVVVAVLVTRWLKGGGAARVPAWRPTLKRSRLTVLAALLAGYLVLPLLAGGAVREADAHSLGVLASQERRGLPLELHRAAFSVDGVPAQRVTVRTLHEEVLELEGPAARRIVASGRSHGRTSLRGTFASRSTVQVEEVHLHASGTRATLSVLGVLTIAVWLGTLVLRGRSRGRHGGATGAATTVSEP